MKHINANSVCVRNEFYFRVLQFAKQQQSDWEKRVAEQEPIKYAVC